MCILNPDNRLANAMSAGEPRLMANCQKTGKQIEVKDTDSLEICPACECEIGKAMHMCNCMIGKFSLLTN